MKRKQHTFFVITFHAAGAQTPAGPLKLQGTVDAYPGSTVASSRIAFYRAVLRVRRSFALASSYTVQWHTYDGTDNPPVDSGMFYHHEDTPVMAHHYSREVVEREPTQDAEDVQEDEFVCDSCGTIHPLAEVVKAAEGRSETDRPDGFWWLCANCADERGAC